MKATRKQYTLDEVIRSLSKKNDVKFSETSGTVLFLVNPKSKNAKHDLGNKSWGKLDYLKNYCGFYFVKNCESMDRKWLQDKYPLHFPERRG